jgi:hypothetical protein
MALLIYTPIGKNKWSVLDGMDNDKRIAVVSISGKPIAAVPGKRLRPMEQTAITDFLIDQIYKSLGLYPHIQAKFREAGVFTGQYEPGERRQTGGGSR